MQWRVYIRYSVICNQQWQHIYRASSLWITYIDAYVYVHSADGCELVLEAAVNHNFSIATLSIYNLSNCPT